MSNASNIPKRVKEPVVRGIAVQVFLLTLAAIYWKSPVILYILLGDFFLRAFVTAKISPLAILSRYIWAPLLKFPLKMVTMRPKKFAASIGFFMSAAALALYLTGYPFIMQLVLAVLALFSFLEGAFRFCAGCKIFGLLIKLGLVKEELCEDCVFPGGEGI